MSNDKKLHSLSEKWLHHPEFVSTLCWSFVFDQFVFIDAMMKVKYTPELAAKRQHLWDMVRRGSRDDGFKEFVVGALATMDEILDGTVDPQQAIALLNSEPLKVVEAAPGDDDPVEDDDPVGDDNPGDDVA